MDPKQITETLELDETTANLLAHLAEMWGVSEKVGTATKNGGPFGVFEVA